MSAARRRDAGAAVGGLFARASATGGLAGRDAERPREFDQASAAADGQAGAVRGEPCVRLGVELSERELAFLRALSRPTRTGQSRTLGAKFVATGVLAAAIELLAGIDVDMYGVGAGDRAEMTARARTALLRAGTANEPPRDKT